MGQAIGATMAASDTMLLGRVTHQGFAAHWPHQTGNIADYMNNAPKLVVSTTPGHRQVAELDPDQRQRRRGADRRKQQPGRNVSIVGSATLVRSLLREGLLDELQLLVCPIVVGSGKRLFEDSGAPVPLRSADTKTFGTGVLSLT